MSAAESNTLQDELISLTMDSHPPMSVSHECDSDSSSPLIHTTQPSPTAQTLFMDGVLLIFSYLSFSDLLAGLHTCHYWYSCGLRERCRDLTFSMRGSEIRSKFLQLLSSPFKFHIGAVTSLNMGLIFACCELSLPNLHTLTCMFGLSHSEETRPEQELPAGFILPKSLTTLVISISAFCKTYNLCQAFLHLLRSDLNLSKIEFITMNDFSFDLAPMRSLPKLTTLDLSRFNDGDPLDSTGLRMYASLPVTKLRLSGLIAPDWTIFEPQSPLMQHILDLNLVDWRPTEQDWNHLTLYPPPQLHTLTIKIDRPDYNLRGLPSLYLKTLHLWIPFHNVPLQEDYSRGVPILSKLYSLTHLSISRLIADDGQLCYILRKLSSVTQLDLTGDRQAGRYRPLAKSLALLPETTMLDYVIYDQFDSFMHDVGKNKRLASLNIDQLELTGEVSAFESTFSVEWTKSCQDHTRSMKHHFQIFINETNGKTIHFNFDKAAQSVISPTTQISLVDAQILFLDGLLTIFQFLSFKDLLPALHTCHHWHSSGLKESCRQLRSSYNHLSTSQLFDRNRAPFNSHVTQLVNFNLIDFVCSNQTTIGLVNLKTLSFLFESCSTLRVPDKFTLPPSLTSLEIKVTYCHTNNDQLCQSLINRIPINSSITELSFCNRTSSPNYHVYDLTPFLRLTKLTHLHLSLIQPLSLNDQIVYAGLPVQQACTSGLTRVDWMIFHPQCPFLLNIRDWNWNYWILTQADWAYLQAHPPPQLRQLSIFVDLTAPIPNLDFLPLTSLSLEGSPSHDYSAYVPNIATCHTLTQLSLNNVQLEGDPLCDLLIALTHLEQFNYHCLPLSHHRIIKALEHVPPQTHLAHVTTDTLESFKQYLNRSTRLRNLSIGNLRLLGPDPLITASNRSRCKHLTKMCQTLTHQLHRLKIEKWFADHLRFRYEKAVNTAHPSTEAALLLEVEHCRDSVPASRLVGIELNPGPFDRNIITSIPSTPGPSATTLFVDGVLSIFSFLSLPDLLPALHSCHYWYSCGLKERCRDMTYNTLGFSDSGALIDITHLLVSPLRFHIGKVTDVGLDLILLLSPRGSLSQLPSLHTLKCYFKRMKIKHTESPLNQEQLVTTFLLPQSLTSLVITISSGGKAVHELCQSFLNFIPHGCSNLTSLEYTNYCTYPFDLSFIRSIERLTDLNLTNYGIYDSSAVSDSCLCVNLPLRKLRLIGLTELDFTTFHNSDSVLMRDIQELDLVQWRPTEDDWNYLMRHPPPLLQRLTLYIDSPTYTLRGLTALNLTALELNIDHHDPSDEDFSRGVPILSQLYSLTHLSLSRLIADDDQLCQILRSLQNLVQLHLSDDRRQGQYRPIIKSLPLLPEVTVIDYVIYHQFDTLMHQMGKNKRLVSLTIEHLQLTNDSSIKSTTFSLEWTKSCQYQCRSMKRFQMSINEIHDGINYICGDDDDWITFLFSKSSQMVIPPNSVPASRLVGIELSTFDRSISSIPSTLGPTATALFVDGILCIFQFLSFPELLPALCACRYWYACGLKERCRQLRYELSSETLFKTQAFGFNRSPFTFHIGFLVLSLYQLSDISEELQLPHLTSLSCTFEGPSRSPMVHTTIDTSQMIVTESLSTSRTPVTPILRLLMDAPITSLYISILPQHISIDSCQTFLTAISRCHQLTSFTFRYSSPVKRSIGDDLHHFNLSSLVQLPQLTHCQLYLPRTFCEAEDQLIYAQLSLTRFICSKLSRPDWNIFHPTSPLMINIHELNWYDWNPRESDWAHLTQHPPPKLHTLTLCLDRADEMSLSGLSTLKLTTFVLESTVDRRREDYSLLIPHLQQLNHSLTHLTLDGSFFTDDQLCELLPSLSKLVSLELNGCTRVLSCSFRFLPQTTKIEGVVVKSFVSFLTYFSQSQHDINILTIDEMDFVDPYASLEFESLEELEELCDTYCQRRKKEWREVRLDISIDDEFKLKYHRIRSVESPPPIVPSASRLVGVEVNPGPAGLAQPSISDCGPTPGVDSDSVDLQPTSSASTPPTAQTLC